MQQVELDEGRLPWRVKALFAVAGTVGLLRLTPPVEDVPAQPVEKRRRGGVSPAWIAGRVPSGVRHRDELVATAAGPVRVRVYRARDDGSELPVLVYLHGGGWVTGTIESTDALCAELALRAGAAVVSVDYRLAPDPPYPAALDDAEAVVRWLLSPRCPADLDPTALSVGGDSAGGNLAAALAIRLRDAGIRVQAQLLLYPALDATLSSASMSSFAGWGLRRRDMRVYWDAYAGAADRQDPGLSPLHVADVRGLAPARVVTAGLDCLRDEGHAYAQRLTDAGVDVSFSHHADLPHGFLTLAGLCPEAYAVLDHVAGFLRSHRTAP